MTSDHVDRPRVAVVVDDEPLVLRLVERMLRDMKWEVHLAGSAVEAIARLAGLPNAPDVLVTDLRMDPVDGPDLARLAHEIHPDLPVVFISGFYQDFDERRLPGMLVRKPFASEDLMGAIEVLLARSPRR